MIRMYYKITDPDAREDLRVWYASSMVYISEQETLEMVRAEAIQRGLRVTYEIVTKKEYDQYQCKIRRGHMYAPLDDMCVMCGAPMPRRERA